jgi:hypothetical protein
VHDGLALLEDGRLVEGRRLLSRALTGHLGAITSGEASTIRARLTEVNRRLVFSPFVAPDDPLAETFEVTGYLSKLAPQWKVTWQLLERVNGVRAERLRRGQQLKTIKGPFHAVVDKSAFRMDVFVQEPNGPAIYVRSFPIGTGEDDSTPVGAWTVAAKVKNPSWTNPRTGKHYAADDPENPVGEYWIRLEGTDDQTRGLQGYGIHGTIEPESIGQQMSMGCIRLLPDDIAFVYELLVSDGSRVLIRP